MMQPVQAVAKRTWVKRALRVPLDLPCEFHGRKLSGRGIVKNVSVSGALIDEASSLLITGTMVRLRFSFGEGASPIEVKGEVSRETPCGFALRFVAVDPRTRGTLKASIERVQQALDESDEAEDAEAPTLLKLRSE